MEKGQWRLNNYHHSHQYIVVHGGDDDNDAFPGQRKICDIWDWDTEKGRANAELIASAPTLKKQRDDLLAACSSFYQKFCDYGRISHPDSITGWHHNQEFKKQILIDFEAAIAAAKT